MDRKDKSGSAGDDGADKKKTVGILSSSAGEPPKQGAMLEAALAYAAAGIPIFPVGAATKSPLVAGGHGHKDATTDEATIRRWFVEHGHKDIGLGMPTGGKSGFDVLDLDRKNGKDGTLHVPNWKTLSPLIVKTQSGGLHLYFKASGRLRSISNSTGVDTRGGNAHVVVPPTRGYEFLQGALNAATRDTLPDWPEGIEHPVVFEHLKPAPGEADEYEPITPSLFEYMGDYIENDDLGWDEWNDLMMTIYAASNGEDHGLQVAHAFSARSDKYDASETEVRWGHLAKYPPTQKSMGSFVWTVRQDAPDWEEEFHVFAVAVQNGLHDAAHLAETVKYARDRHLEISPVLAGHLADVFDVKPERIESAFKQPSPDPKDDEDPPQATNDPGPSTESAKPSPPSEIGFTDFVAYMPDHSYCFVPTLDFWPATSVNARLPRVRLNNKWIKASDYLDRNRPVEQATWAPGEEWRIKDKLIAETGWIERPGCRILNLYRPPIIQPKPADVSPWLNLINKLYPDNAEHILRWLAHRRQRPGEKINHALVLGGAPGIGKDTILVPMEDAVGPGNFHNIAPTELLGDWNGYLRSVVLLISESRDLGDINRYAFYEHTKTIIASPPNFLRVNEKYIKQYYLPNLCGVVITTNHKTDGMYLPADDRRHYMTWSEAEEGDFEAGFFKEMYDWYAKGGTAAIVAYLDDYDLSNFDPKAPPLKTPAFWEVVNASRGPEEGDMVDALEALGWPDALIVNWVRWKGASDEYQQWLGEPRNRKAIPYHLDRAGYAQVSNPNEKRGRWQIEKKSQVVYAKKALSVQERIVAAQELSRLHANDDEPF